MQVTLPVEALKAAATLAPKHDVRYYLQSVCIERTEQGKVFVVATDGHALSAQWIVQDETVFEQPFQCLLPFDAVKALPKAGTAELTYLPGEEEKSARYSIKCGAGAWAGDVQEGRYPDWRRIVPRTASDEPAQFDADLLQRLQKAARMAYGQKGLLLSVHYNGDAGTLVSAENREDWIGVIMPWKPKHPLSSVESLTTAFTE